MADLISNLADQNYTGFLSGSAVAETRIINLDVGVDNLADDAKWRFLRVPANTIILSAHIEVSDLDSGGSPALTLDLEAEDVDGGNTTTLLNNSTAGQAGGSDSADTALPLFGLAKDFYIQARVETVPATAAAGTAKLVVQYIRDNS